MNTKLTIASYNFNGHHYERTGAGKEGVPPLSYSIDGLEVSKAEWIDKLDAALAHELAARSIKSKK